MLSVSYRIGALYIGFSTYWYRIGDNWNIQGGHFPDHMKFPDLSSSMDR